MKVAGTATFALAAVRAGTRVALVWLALSTLEGKLTRGVVLSVAIAAGYALEQLIAAAYRSKVEVDLARTLLRGLFAAEIQTTVPETLFLGGVYEGSRLIAGVFPALLGDICAAMAVTAIAARAGYGTEALRFIGCLTIGLSATLALRHAMTADSRAAWARYEQHGQRVLDALQGVPELVASGRAQTYEHIFGKQLREWRRASNVVAIEAILVGRLPIAIGVLGSIGLDWLLGASRLRAVEWAFLASTLPPFAGIAASLGAYVRLAGPARAVRSLARSKPRTFGHAVPKRFDMELRGVSVQFGDVTALDGISVHLDHSTVISGANGSGKSTLLRALVGLVDPTAGDLLVGGIRSDAVDWRRVRERIAYLPQKPYLPLGSVRDSLLFLVDTDDERARAALERVGLWNVLESKLPSDPLAVRIDQLSAGERQRVAIARMLIRTADVYLLDEPDANLDADGIDELVHILRELAAERTVIVSAHSRRIAEALGRSIELEHGRVKRDKQAYSRQ